MTDEKPKIAGPWRLAGSDGDLEYHERKYVPGTYDAAASVICCPPRCIWSAWCNDELLAEGDEHIDLGVAQAKAAAALRAQGAVLQ